MTGSKFAGVVFAVALAVIVVQIAGADTVTAETAKGKCYLTVAASGSDVYCFQLWLQKGSFHSWEAPAGWTWQQLSGGELLFETVDAPIVADGPPLCFMVKATGPGRNTVWETLGADGTVLDWGRVDLK